MEQIHAGYAWLGAQTSLLAARLREDRGEGPVAYLAVIILIAAIAGLIFGLGLPGKISGALNTAVDNVINKKSG
ncbi:hypothetical protein ACFVH6_17595 [Spirillospora sp. NPDC127200]